MKRVQFVCLGCLNVVRLINPDPDMLLECKKCGCCDHHYTKKEAIQARTGIYGNP